MTNSPAYLWYPRDVFDSERVDALSPAEECWYRRALDRSWGDEGISADPTKAAKRIGKKCTVKAAEMILKTFFEPKPKDPTKMVMPRQEKERKKLFEKSKQKSAAGKKGMAKRWKQTSKDDNSVITPLEVCNNISIPISSSISIQDKEEEKEKEAASPPAPAEASAGTGFDSYRWESPAVLHFEEIFGFKTGSGFASSVSKKVLDLETWVGLLENKRAFADKPLVERKRICNWILDEYDKRITEKQNGGNQKPTSEREKSADRTSNSLAAIAELRRQAAEEERAGQVLLGSSNGDHRSVNQLGELPGSH